MKHWHTNSIDIIVRHLVKKTLHFTWPEVLVPHSQGWVRHLSLHRARSINLPSGLFPPSYRTKTLYAPFLSHHRQYLLIYSKEQIPTWKADRFSSTQEIPRILWKAKVRYRFQKCPPPVHVLRQISPIHTIALPEDPSSYYPLIYVWIFQVDSFHPVSPPKLCMHLPSPYVLQSPSKFFSIWSSE